MLQIYQSIPDNYYTRSEVSCSTLKSVKQALTLKQQPSNLQNIFDYGSLVDALVTEEENIDHGTNTLHLAHGGTVQFNDTDWAKACEQKANIMKHPYAKLIFENSETQMIGIDDDFTFRYGDYAFSMPVRLRMDALRMRIKTGADLKTTSCATLKQCVASIKQFDYDFQGAMYMEVMNLDKFVFVFSSKVKKKETFIHAMERGDDLYQSGIAKMNYWAFQYWMLVWSLGPHLNPVPVTIDIEHELLF